MLTACHSSPADKLMFSSLSLLCSCLQTNYGDSEGSPKSPESMHKTCRNAIKIFWSLIDLVKKINNKNAHFTLKAAHEGRLTEATDG